MEAPVEEAPPTNEPQNVGFLHLPSCEYSWYMLAGAWMTF